MTRPERSQWWQAWLGVALLLCLAWPGIEARGSAWVATEPDIGSEPASAMASDPMPMSRAMDCAPCAFCCGAPPPASHTSSGECERREDLAWWVQALWVQEPQRHETAEGLAQLPVRILFCRWLD